MEKRTTLYMFVKNGAVNYVNGINHTINSITHGSYNAFMTTKITLMENTIDQIFPGSSEAIYFSESVRLGREIKWIDIPTNGYIISEFYRLVREHMKNNVEYNTLSKIVDQYSHTGIYLQPDLISETCDLIEDYTRNNPLVFSGFLKYIVSDRNDIWITRINAATLLAPVFVVCGYSHLSDLLQKLRLNGYEVYPVIE